MSDHRKGSGPSGLIGADGRVPRSLGGLHTKQTDAAREQAEKPCTEGRAAELITAGIIGGLADIVRHFEEANREHMLTMEVMVYQRIMEDLERRTIRGKIKLRWLLLKEWAAPWLIEAGMLDPIPPAPPVKLEKAP